MRAADTHPEEKVEKEVDDNRQGLYSTSSAMAKGAPQMQTIEIDFDVFKKLTEMRKSEADSYNDVLRRTLGLSVATKKTDKARTAFWACRGGNIPVGTKLRARHKSHLYEAEVTHQGIKYDNKRYGTPSEAAFRITRTNVNGWRFWEAQLPGATNWCQLSGVR